MWLQRLRLIIREFLGITPTLDLHGLGVRDALAETERFVRHASTLGEPVVRIVYGKGHGSPGGRGVLRDVIPRWLEREGAEWVERYQRLPDASGADGAVKVWLRRARKASDAFLRTRRISRRRGRHRAEANRDATGGARLIAVDPEVAKELCGSSYENDDREGAEEPYGRCVARGRTGGTGVGDAPWEAVCASGSGAHRAAGGRRRGVARHAAAQRQHAPVALLIV